MFVEGYFTIIFIMFRIPYLQIGLNVVKGNTVLSPSPAIGIHGEPFTLKCEYNGSKSVDGFLWVLDKRTTAILLVPACTPFANPGPPDPSLYEYACSENKSSTFTIKKITDGNNGNIWRCAASVPEYQYSGSVTLTVQVAVKTVKLTPPTNSIMESVESLFTSETSASRPAANVSWFKESVTGQSQEITDGISWTSEAQGDLAKSISLLKYIPSRNDNGAKMYCTALNIPERTPVTSATFRLNVQYSPDGPPKIQGYADGNTYKVIENTQGRLSCSVKRGNPLAILTWDCFNNGSSPLSVNSTVTRTVTWSASPGQDRPCTCHASHPVVGDQSVSVNVQVLYKASITLFVVQGYTEPPVSVTVNENDNVPFVCSVDSNPDSSIEIQFHGKTLQRQDNTNSLAYTHNNAACLDAGIYRCSAENQYNYGNLSLMELTLYVRCTPRPLHKSGRDFTSALNVPMIMRFTALAYPEPGQNGFVWHKENGFTWVPLLSNTDLLISSSELQTNLTIKNVSKSDYGHYRVTVTNEIGKYEQYMFLTEEDINKETSVNTTLVVGITLGILCAVVFVYAISATVLLKRKSKCKETHPEPLDKSHKQTTFVNRNFTPDDFASAGRGYTQNNAEPTNEGYEEPIHQYTALERHANDDRMPYDFIQQT